MLVNIKDSTTRCSNINNDAYYHDSFCELLIDINNDYEIEDFPELIEYCPKNDINYPSGNYWFSWVTKEGYDSRVRILKECISKLEG